MTPKRRLWDYYGDAPDMRLYAFTRASGLPRGYFDPLWRRVLHALARLFSPRRRF
jgi:hypothetical protein